MAPMSGEVAARFLCRRRHGPHADHRAPLRAFVPLNSSSPCRGCLRVYNRYGRRDNKYKARIKILVHELGLGNQRQVEEEFAHLQSQTSSRRWPSWSGSRRISPPALKPGWRRLDLSNPGSPLGEPTPPRTRCPAMPSPPSA
jgi:sulfite reductase (NADPH) hemoprotein beta-component